ncbi:MAG TPA: hypothetical protein PKY77_20860 [Phycisphaerae bacterium]|nr:hypothetical protein [Phycisphaerae bacterium]
MRWSAILAVTLVLSAGGVCMAADPVDTVWVEDAVPTGGVTTDTGWEAWTWVTENPSPASGTQSHQSPVTAGIHQHCFRDATATLSVIEGDAVFIYVYLDPTNPPTEVMVQWREGTSWDHRAYWGANSIPWGTDGTNSRRYMGALPATGQWVRLEVPASQVGLEGKTLNGMAHTLYGGQATWDKAGKVSRPAADVVWSGGGTTNNWSEAANWTGGMLPRSIDTAIFDGTSAKNCTLDVDVAPKAIKLNAGYTGVVSCGTKAITVPYSSGAGLLSVAAGELKLGSATHTINGSLSVTGGAVTPETSKVVFVGQNSATTSVSGPVTLNNVKFDPGVIGASCNKTISLSGTVTVNGLLEVFGYDMGGWNLHLTGTGTLVAKGNIAGNSKVFRGTANMLVAGDAGNQTQTDFYWGTSGTYTVDKPAGQLVLAGVAQFGDPTTSASAETKIVLNTVVDAVSQQPTVRLCGYAYGDVKITGNLTAYNVTFYRSGGTGTSCYDLGASTLTVENTLTLDLTATCGWHVIFAEGGTIAAKGNVVCTSVLGADWSGVNFLVNGSGDQTVALGGLSLYKVKVDKPAGAVTFTGGFVSKHEFKVAAGNTVNFGAGDTFAVKWLELAGAVGNLITFRSATDGTAWKLNVTDKYQTPSKVDVKDCDASGGQQIVGTGCVDSGANLNWRFVDAVFVSFLNGTSSVTSPAWVYGECGPNVTTVQLKVNAGTAFDVVRYSSMRWYADNASAGGDAIGIGLSATAATGLEVIGTDAQNNQQSATQSIEWMPTNIAVGGSLTIRRGDSLLLTAPGTGTLEIDANGDSTMDYTGQAGDKYAYKYSTAGVYSATAKVGGTTVGTVTVTVVEAVLPTVLACQKDNTIVRKIVVNPAAQAANVTVNLSADGTVNITPTVVSDGINVAFYATETVAPRIFARIGGDDGPVLATDMLRPFKFVYAGPDVPRREVYADGDAKFMHTIKMEPFVPGAKLQFATYSGGATFENGSYLMQKMSDDLGDNTYTFPIYAPKTWGVTCHQLYVIP